MKSEEFLTPEGMSEQARRTTARRRALTGIRGRMNGVWKLLYAAFFILHSSFFISCSEADDTVEEYADWQAKNEAYFEQQYQSHAAATATSFVLKKLSLPDSLSVSQVSHMDCVLVDVLKAGDGLASPLFTDTVEVHYKGQLIASPTYPQGYEFDSSYSGTFDPAVSVPAELQVSMLVEGFATAVQHMHRGDYWRVTIPYQLGYSTSETGSIPAYSTLIFEIRLEDFY